MVQGELGPKFLIYTIMEYSKTCHESQIKIFEIFVLTLSQTRTDSGKNYFFDFTV